MQHLHWWSRTALVIFSTVHLKVGGFFPAAFLAGLALVEQINHWHATSLLEFLLPPGGKYLITHFLSSTHRARKRLVSYKRKTGRGDWGGEKQIKLITENVPCLLVSSYLGIREDFDHFNKCFTDRCDKFMQGLNPCRLPELELILETHVKNSSKDWRVSITCSSVNRKTSGITAPTPTAHCHNLKHDCVQRIVTCSNRRTPAVKFR